MERFIKNFKTYDLIPILIGAFGLILATLFFFYDFASLKGNSSCPSSKAKLVSFSAGKNDY